MTEQPRDRKSGAIEATRVTIQREVDLRYPHFQGFVTEVSANLSMTGMFVCSDQPQPVGTVFAFRFRIEDWKLIQGTARVIWIRNAAEGPDRPPGMGVRFVELDAQSRRMVRWLVERHLHQGGKPFELGSEQIEDLGSADESPAALEAFSATRAHRSASLDGPLPKQSQSAAWRALRRSRRRSRKLVWAAVLLLTVIVAFVAAWRTTYRSPSARASAANRAAASASGAGQTTARQESPGAASAPSTARIEAEVADTVRAWAAAWSEQKVTEYLSHYSSDFSPEGPMSREEWLAWRRERVAAPEYINIAITALEISLPEEGAASVAFFQTYRSDAFTDTVRKTLTLVREEGGWKIAREVSSPA